MKKLFRFILPLILLTAVSCSLSSGPGGGGSSSSSGGSSNPATNTFWEDDSAYWVNEAFFWGYPETPDVIDTNLEASIFTSKTISGSFQKIKAISTKSVLYAVDPIFNPVEGTYSTSKLVQCKSTTSGAVVHYTTNGDDPTVSSPVYSSKTFSSGTVTIKAIATAAGMSPSRIVKATYCFQTAPASGTVGSPAFSPVEGVYYTNKSVQIKSQTTGARIYYTVNGPDPTTSSSLYSTAIPLNSGTTVIKAIAVKSGLTASPVITQNYTINGFVNDPVYTLIDNHTSKYIAIDCTTAGSAIYNTTGGTEPDTASTLYTAACPLPAGSTVRAKAYKTGWTASHTVDYSYTTYGKTADPSFSMPSGTNAGPFVLTMECLTPGSAVIWSLDGGINWNWNASNAVFIRTNTTVTAKAVRTGYDDSDRVTGSWVILNHTYTVTFDSLGGTVVTNQSVTYGGHVFMPSETWKTNYMFNGWFKDSDCLYRWNFVTDVVSHDLTLYASWLPPSLGLVYTLNNNNTDYSVTGAVDATYLIIPDNWNGKKITSIGDYAFCNFTALTKLILPASSLNSIGMDAFSNCINLFSINIPNSITNIGSNAFEYSCLTNIIIPDSVSSIGSYAFHKCINLTNVIIPNSVTNIDEWAFMGCFSLASINIPSSLSRVGPYVFASCTKITNIFIPDSVVNIDTCAFLWCTSLSSVVIPGSVTNISYAAFADCTNLSSATFINSNCNLSSLGVFWLNKAGFTVYAPAGGTVQTYCTNSGIPFVGY
jgi:uncharacterized repeat protein (TIGR02543 family)